MQKVNKMYYNRITREIHVSHTNATFICKCCDDLLTHMTYCCFTPQVRERLRVALERVSMLEDQLAASSQEVKFCASGSYGWCEKKMEMKNTLICFRLPIVCFFPGNLIKRPN